MDDHGFIFIEGTDFCLQPCEILSPDGYKPPKNFPDCCAFHRNVVQHVENFMEKFPNCCEPHIAFSKKPFFNPIYYKGMTSKVLNQLSYTEYKIQTNLENENWYKDVTDYIEWANSSFGHPAVAQHIYLFHLKYFVEIILESHKDYPKEKQTLLLEYINGLSAPPEGDVSDIRELIDTYEKWLSTFPFNLPYFVNLKAIFQKNMPLLQGKIEYNPYTKLSKAKLQTRAALLEFLVSATKELLKKVSTPGLIKDGAIADSCAHTIIVTGEEHRVRQLALVEQYSKGEMEYVKVLRKWLKNEVAYFNKVSPLLQQQIQHELNSEHKKMTIKVTEELKPIAGALTQLGLGYYLQTDHYNQLLLEHNFDELWSGSMGQVNPGDIILVTNTNAVDNCFFNLANQLWDKNKKKFFRFLTVSIVGFANNIHGKKDFSKVLKYVTDLQFPETDQEQINVAVIQRGNAGLENDERPEPKPRVKMNKPDCIFIGHGRSLAWRVLADYLRDEGYANIAFETENRTGQHIVDILKEFLDQATFAIIVATAEDETATGTTRARQNVTHEIGLFQGRLGFDKVAILKQEGTEPFTNNDGIQYIGFTGDQIEQTFHQLGRALQKAGIPKNNINSV